MKVKIKFQKHEKKKFTNIRYKVKGKEKVKEKQEILMRGKTFTQQLKCTYSIKKKHP